MCVDGGFGYKVGCCVGCGCGGEVGEIWMDGESCGRGESWLEGSEGCECFVGV